MSFTTVESVKTFLNRDELSSKQSTLVQMLIGLIDGVICNYCGWNLLAKDYVGKNYDGSGVPELHLKVYPVNSVAKVAVYDGSAYHDVTANLMVNGEDGTLIYADRSTTFPAGRLNVAVDFNGGYAEGAVPADLAYAANYLVTMNFNRIETESIGIASETFNQVEVIYDSIDIPDLVKRLLDRYKLI